MRTRHAIRPRWPFAEAAFANQASEFLQTKGAIVLRLLLVGCTTVALLLGAFALAGDRLGLWEPVQAPPASVQADEDGVRFRPTGLAEAATRDPRVDFDATLSHSPSAPLGARTAFLLATLAGAIGLLSYLATERPRLPSEFAGAWSARVRGARRLSVRTDLRGIRAVRPRLRVFGPSVRVLTGFASLPATVYQAPRRALTIAAGTRARPSFHLPRGVVALHILTRRYRPEVTFSVVAVALGVAVGCLAALFVG